MITTTTETVVIARQVKSCNEWMYKHFRAYMTERDFWMVLLRVKLAPRRGPGYPVHMRIVSLRNRLLDKANFIAGTKPIPDCFKRLGLIQDDSPRWFTCDYDQEVVAPAFRCTRITWGPA